MDNLRNKCAYMFLNSFEREEIQSIFRENQEYHIVVISKIFTTNIFNSRLFTVFHPHESPAINIYLYIRVLFSTNFFICSY